MGLGFIFYRVIWVIWRKICLLFRSEPVRSEERGGRGRGSTDRVMEMLSQRPQILDILASRWQAQRQESSHSQEQQDEHDSRADRQPKPPDREPSFDPNMQPPAYDTLSLHSGPPPSYHSDIDNIDR